MEATPLSVRLGLWRLTRHPVTRQIYDTVERAGVFVAQLDRFERAAVATGESPDLPNGVELSTARASELLPERLVGEPIAPSDTIVWATRNGETVGSCCLSDRPVYVPELHRRLTFEGAYLWKLHVRRSERGQGIGSAIIAHAIDHSATDADRIVALVAPDNLPSRRAFGSLGFQPTERFTSVGCGPVEHHRRQTLGQEPTPG